MTWLSERIHNVKDESYADRTLAQYRLGIASHGSIRGVRIDVAPGSCAQCLMYVGKVYQPDDIPRIPLATCSHSEGCRCAYRPVMTYEE